MPLTAGGKLKIVASADLGALGAMNGSPVEYPWTRLSLAPLLLPWLAILGLLVLKPNRQSAAWLIWLPLGCVAAFAVLVRVLVPARTSFLLEAFSAASFGLAAVWLVANYLRRSHRFLTFLCILVVLAGFGGTALLSNESRSLADAETVAGSITLGAAILVTSAALGLGSWILRRRFHPIGIYPCLLLSLAAIWVLIATAVRLIIEIPSRGTIPWDSWFEFLMPVLMVAMINFVLLLPFLILSSASSFFRERLKALLHVQEKTPLSLSAVPLNTRPNS